MWIREKKDTSWRECERERGTERDRRETGERERKREGEGVGGAEGRIGGDTFTQNRHNEKKRITYWFEKVWKRKNKRAKEKKVRRERVCV